MTDKRCAHGWLNHADCEVCALLAECDKLRKDVTLLRDELNTIYKLVPDLVVLMKPPALAATEQP